MKLHSLAKRLTAALLSGAMALSLCAPALAAGADVLPQLSVPGAQPLNAENSTGSFTINDINYVLPPDGEDLAYESLVGGSIFYSSANQQLTLTGPFSSKMDISAPGLNVVMSSSNGSVVANDLTITASASVTISNEGSAAQAITGTADITSDGDVRITGTDRAVGGKMLTVNAGGDVEITGGCAGAAIWHSANITSGGSVTIGSANENGWAQGSKNGGEKLTITAAQDVTLTGNGTTSYPVVNNASIQCGGDLKIQATNDGGKAAGGTLAYRNTSSVEKVLRDANSFKVVAAGDSVRVDSTASLITAQAEQRYTVTVENGYALDIDNQKRNSFYKGEMVGVYVDRPVDALEFDHWVYPESVTLNSSNPPCCSFSMPGENITIGSVWTKANNAEIALAYDYGNVSVTLTPSNLDSIENVTFKNNTFTFTGDFTNSSSDLVLQGLADPKTGALPSVVLIGKVDTNLAVDGGVENVTVSVDRTDGYALGESSSINCRGDVNIKNQSGGAVGYDLSITNARNVNVTAASVYAYAIENDAEISCSGSVNITNTKGRCVGDDLNIHNAQDVTVSADCSGIDPSNNYYTFAIHDDAEINCSGNVKIENENGGGVFDNLTVYNAQNVTVSANASTSYAVYYTTVITCSGDVTLTNPSGAVLDYPLIINSARNVTIEGSVFYNGDELIGYNSSEEHSITCSGIVTLKNNGKGALFTNQLTYTPDSTVESYTIQKDGQPMRENATGAVVFTCSKSDDDTTRVYALTDDGTDASADTWDNDLTGAKELVITPTLRPVDTGDITGSGAGNVGGAIAAAMVGGAAVWGGYEVVTRVMLHKLLPEGAAIPTTRGELALLLWNTAGRPEPANIPAFADTADTELAKAAQWCTEQGCLTAQDDGTFKPDKHVTKYSVIRTWTKAFPKQ